MICVGLGETKHAERYCGKLAPSLTCITSTTNDPYYDWGIYQTTTGDAIRGMGKVLLASGKAMMHGHSQGKATGDARMTPGTFIVDSDGKIVYAYYGKIAGDDPEIDELVAAANKLQMQS